MKILYVTTVSITMGFFPEHFKMLVEEGHKVELASNLEKQLREDIVAFGFEAYHIPFSRSPLSKDNIKAYKQLKKLITEKEYDIVHCHTPVAAICTRLACRKARKNGTKVFYTAHGFHFYKGAPLKNWLVYYPAEWLCSFWTDTLITINREDYHRAQQHMHAKKTVYVPGVGIDLNKFGSVSLDRAEKRRELGIPENAVLLLSVGELNENKNHETVIRAIAGMDVYYILAGQGDRQEKLKAVVNEVGMSGRVKLLGYRTDLGELYETADAFVFPSYREGLSVSLMEAMAKGLVCAVSQIRGNVDLIDKDGGRFFAPNSIDDCKRTLEHLLNSDRTAMGQHNMEKIKEFDVGTVVERMRKIYKY